MRGQVSEWVPLFAGSFAACGRRVTLPMAARRRKVRLSPFPPDGENCARSLAPPLPGEPAALGFAGRYGRNSPKRRRGLLRGAPFRCSKSPHPGPHYEGRVPAEFYKISGAQNLSGISQFNPGHWALGLQKLLLLRLLFRAWLDRAGGGWC